MTALKLKWHNLSLAVRIKLSPDAKIILFILCVFFLIGLAEISKVALDKFDAVVIALAGALITGVVKDFKSNKLDVEVADKNLGQKLTEIKKAARGEETGGNPGHEVTDGTEK